MKDFLEILNNLDLTLYLSFFAITIASQLVGTLRSIFVANKAGTLAYVMVGIDALLYTLLVSALTKQTTLTIIIFILGKLLGTYLANEIESRIALGIYDIDLYVNNHDLQKSLQEAFLAAGISSTMNLGTISGNEVRWSLNVQLKRKDMAKFYQIINDNGISTPNMVIRPAKKVTGAIEEHLRISDTELKK